VKLDAGDRGFSRHVKGQRGVFHRVAGVDLPQGDRLGARQRRDRGTDTKPLALVVDEDCSVAVSVRASPPMLATLTRTITYAPSAVSVAPSRSVRVLLGRCTEVTVKTKLPSRMLSPMVAVTGVTFVALSALDSTALEVKPKILGSLPSALTMMITKRRVTADGRAMRPLSVRHEPPGWCLMLPTSDMSTPDCGRIGPPVV